MIRRLCNLYSQKLSQWITLLQLDYFLNKFSDKINSSIARAKNIAFTFTNKFIIGYADFYAKIFQVEVSDNFYTQLEKFFECNRICKIKITGIKEFVNQYKKELVAIIYPEITSAK